MKKFLRVGKRTISVVLSVIMIVSTMLVGVSSANAININDETVSTLSESGINDEIDSDVSVVQPVHTKTASNYKIYLKNQDDAWTPNNSKFYAYFCNNGTQVGNAWPGYAMTIEEGTNLYSVEVPSGASQVIFNNNSGTQYPGYNAGFISISGSVVFNTASKETIAVDSSQKYAYTGGKNSWTNYYSSASKISTKVDNIGTYKTEVTVNNDSERYFRIIDTNNTQFGPYVENDYQIPTTAASAYEGSKDSSKAFYFPSTGTYELYVRDAYHENNRPDVWAIKKEETTQNYTVTYAVSPATSSMGTLTATVDSGAAVTSGTSVTFTATPNANYYVEGWYSDSASTTKLNSSTANEITLSITADTEVYVKFTDTQVVTPTYANYYYQNYVLSEKTIGTQTEEIMAENGSATQLYSGPGEMASYYAYYTCTISGDNYFTISDGTTTYYYSNDYYKNDYLYSDVSIGEHGKKHVENNTFVDRKFAKSNSTQQYYIVVYYPNTKFNSTSHPIIAAYTELPDGEERYSVTIKNDIASRLNGTMGTSYLDGVLGQTSIKKTYDDLNVMFTTETTDTVHSDFSFSGKMYQVYGYSILMTLTDSKGKEYTQVTGIVNPLGDTESDRPISALGNGVYQYLHTFPSNIKSATVTPVYTVSDEYAKAKGITFTTVYLKSKPGSSVFGGTYEPQYYTWRSKADNDATGTPYTVTKNNRVLEREPEGAWDGQTMLHSNDDMYIAYVQSDIEGIVFNNGTTNQTYDFDEFIKLQKLGYDNITFEPKSGSGNTVSESINTLVSNDTIVNGSVVYTDNGNSVTIDDTLINSDFELDVDIEGYYIDVFGDRLTNTDGNEIYRPAFLKTSRAITVADELGALLKATGKSNKIYGARYGWYTTTDDDYGMEYAIRNYYIDGTTKKLISQQISGYGTIEGAISPKNPTMNNAAYMTSLNDKLTYYAGERTSASTDDYTLQYFTYGYELISSDYKGLPYLVSYKQQSNARATGEEKDQSDAHRIDGKWYYMSKTPQISVDAKVGLMNADGTIVMNGDIIAVQSGIGSAYVNGKESDTFAQGSSATLSATPASGYKYVGFYESDGKFISTSNPYTSVYSSSTTVYAVFQEIEEGSLTVTNNVYGNLQNPVGGGGNGTVTVKLIVTPQNADGSYGTPVEVNGVNSVSYQIKDGDIFQYVITGTPSGIDKFLTFRLAETLEDGSVYNSPLDDSSCLSNNGTTYTYTSYECVWNWYDQTGQSDANYHTINLYTDFSKTSIYVKLQYKYINRFGAMRTYIKNNVLLTEEREDDIANYTPSNETILNFAPPIDEVFTSCTWIIDKDNSTLTQNGSVITLSAIQEPKKFWTYVDIGDGSLPTPTEKYFNEMVTIEAPKTNAAGHKFSYWVRFLTDSDGNVPTINQDEIDVSKGEIFSYYNSTQIRVTFNSYYLAVYDKKIADFTTNLQNAIYTREKFTNDDGTVTDYVYADFLLQFEANGSDTFKNIVNNSEPGSIKFGIVREIDQAATSYDGTNLEAPTTNADLVKSTILANAAGLDAGESAKSWCNTTDKTSPQYNHYYYINDLTDRVDLLTTFGRYDFYYRFDNTEANRGKVYNVYTYIIYTDKDGNQQIVISDPKVMNIYECGIKEDGTTVD